MLARRFRTASCAVFALLVAFALPAAADDPFTVGDVHVDVTGANSLAARDTAQAEGQAKAFAILMQRVAAGKGPHVGGAQITDLVVGYEVANERTSAVRYVADYTFHFNAAAVRRMLEGSSVAMVEAPAAPAKPVLVLPVFTSADRSDLWDDPNPWRDAWARHVGGEGPLTLVVPVGDLADVAAIDAPKAIAGDPAAIKAISARYRNDDVMVVQATMPPGQPRRLDISATRYTAGNPAPLPTLLTATAKPGEGDGALLARAVAETIAVLGKAAKAQAAATADTGAGSIIEVTLTSGSLGDWVAVRNRLRGVPSLRGADLLSFDRAAIHIAIRYAGDRDQFKAALGERGLDLSGADPDWKLAVHAAPPAPPTEPTPAPAPEAAHTDTPKTDAPKPDGGDTLRKANQ